MGRSYEWAEKQTASFLPPDHPRFRFAVRMWVIASWCFALAAGGMVIGAVAFLIAVLV
jgi:hypothetical protein